MQIKPSVKVNYQKERQTVMRMQLGLHGATIPQASFLQGLREAASAGFSAYEPEVARVAACTPSEFREALAVQNTFGLALLPLNEIEAFGDLTLERAREIFTLAQRLSIRAVTVCPVATKGPLSTEEGVVALKRFSLEAASFQISLYLEMMCFRGRPFNTFEGSLRLAERSGMKLVLDTFHYIVAGATPDEIRRLPAELIGVVHITDAVTDGKLLKDLVDADRVLPGEGGLPLVETMDAIRQTGYRGGMSVEVFHPKYGTQAAADVAREAHRRATSLLRESGWIKEETP
jgi:sugar phosphate isomerase/epimerase